MAKRGPEKQILLRGERASQESFRRVVTATDHSFGFGLEKVDDLLRRGGTRDSERFQVVEVIGGFEEASNGASVVDDEPIQAAGWIISLQVDPADIRVGEEIVPAGIVKGKGHGTE